MSRFFSKKYKNLAFFTFENEALYRIFSKDYHGETHGYIYCLMFVAEFYGMTFNNITNLELAFDSDFNFVKKIRKMIKDVVKYDLYLNGKKVDDNEEILDGYGEYYSRNRTRCFIIFFIYIFNRCTSWMKNTHRQFI